MKKLLLVILLSLATVAQADPYHHGHRGGWGYGWVAPAIIGGIVTYELTRQPPPPPTVIVQPPTVYQPYPQAPYGYHYENILDANCNCYRLVLVQNLR